MDFKSTKFDVHNSETVTKPESTSTDSVYSFKKNAETAVWRLNTIAQIGLIDFTG